MGNSLKGTLNLGSWVVFKVSDSHCQIHCAWSVVRRNITVVVQGKARMLPSSSQETKKKEQEGQGLATIESMPAPQRPSSSRQAPLPTGLLIPSCLFSFYTHQWNRVKHWLCLNPEKLIIFTNTPQTHSELCFANVLVISQFKQVNKTIHHTKKEKLGLRDAPLNTEKTTHLCLMSQ